MSTGEVSEVKTAPPLGVAQLERLRRSIVGEAGRPREPLSEGEFALTRAVLDCLGVALEPVHRYLYSAMPTLAELERWVLEAVGGRLDRARIEHANAIAVGAPPRGEWLARIERIDSAPPVLSEADLAFWAENGYVVLARAAPAEACEALEKAIWAHLRARSEDPRTWYQADLQQGAMVQLFQAPGIPAIHDSERIHKAFAQLTGTANLITSVERCAFNPPLQAGSPFPPPRLAFGLASFERPIADELRGIVYLTDAPHGVGAFRCVPGFHRRIEAWLAELPPGRHPHLEDLEALGAQPVPGHRGDLVIWRSSLPHGLTPNTTARPHLAHYVTMYPPPRPPA